jgi:hypothetical protein
MRELCRKVKEGVTKLAADKMKELLCEAGRMGPDGEAQPQQQQRKRRRQKRTAACRHCGAVGHERTTSSQCLKNPKTLALAAEKAAEKATGAVGESNVLGCGCWDYVTHGTSHCPH